MEVKAGVSAKGFLLKNVVNFSNRVSVLTGLNGSGKTRFIECLIASPESVSVNGVKLQQGQIVHANVNGTPAVGRMSQTGEMQNVYKGYGRAQFDESGHILAGSASMEAGPGGGRMDFEPLIRRAARKTGKVAKDLTHADLDLHYCMLPEHSVGMLDVSGIFNNYLYSVDRNNFYDYRASKYGDDVTYYSFEEFVEKFGPEPWVLLNDIMNDVFGGKFQFEIPEVGSMDYSRGYALLNNRGEHIRTDFLSSGEKVLLWLVSTIFSSLYVDREFVSAPKVLLFDEPDACLHPKMVTQMYRAFSLFCDSFDCHLVFTTHSPTTVALASEGSVYLVLDNEISAISKDLAISSLLDGVSSISLDSQNRRQVYVESLYDVESFQNIYSFMAGKAQYGLDDGVSLSFVPSGSKVPEQLLLDSLKRFNIEIEEAKISQFVESVNGVGSCAQVYGAVESLLKRGNKTVRGVVDWDGKNKSESGVFVFSENKAYSIENVLLDPLCMVDFIVSVAPLAHPIASFCGRDVSSYEWSNDESLLQRSIENYVQMVLGEPFQGDTDIEYVSGLTLKMDSRYFHRKGETGHDLESKIKDVFKPIRNVAKKEGDLKRLISTQQMTRNYSGKFIPKDFLDIFQALHS